MRIRRLDRLVAALLLTALAAALALLAQPSAAASLESYDVRASVRYGCATDDTEDNFVEVSLRAQHWQDHRELVLQVGLAGPDSTDTAVFPEGGPSLVTLSDDSQIKVRLAGPVHDGDHVFLRQLDQPDVVTLPLKPNCHKIKPTNFGLDTPKVKVSATACSPGAQANLKVTLDNPNDVDERLENLGIDQIDYTVLLVRHDGQLAGSEPIGTLVSFDEPSSSVVTLSQTVPKPATYQVRVIGLDGAVVSSDNLRLSCAGSTPGSSSPARPTPTVPSKTPAPSTTRPSTTPPTKAPSSSTSRPAPSSSHPSSPSASRPAPSSPAGTSASHQPPATSAASTAAPGRTATAVPTSSAPVRSTTSSPAPSTSHRGQPLPGPVSTTPPASGSSAPAASPSPTSSVIRLVEPRTGYRGVAFFQKDIALVLLAFCAGMAALVGSSMVAARRR